MTKGRETPATAALGEAPPTPRFAGLFVTLVYSLTTLALAYPALGGKLLLNPRSDQLIAGYSFREFATSYFQEHGSVPQWNPYLFGGLPFVDAMHGDTFYPTALLRLLIGTGPGMTWGLIIHVFLAGVFTYLFLRSIGLSFFSALAGGVAFQLAGNFVGLVSPGHDGKMFVSTLLPAALVCVVRGVRDGKRWAWGTLALVIGLAVLSPHPQLLQYMLLAVGAFALFLALGWGSEHPMDRTIGLRRLGFSLGSVGLGLAMGAIQYLPLKNYTPWSPRTGGKGWEHAVSYSLPPEEAINFVLPQFSGILDSYWGRNNIHFHSDYVGVTVLILAGLAFGAWKTRVQRRLVWFWASTFAITLLWAMGGFTPFYKLVYYLVPGTKYFRAPSTILFIVAFAAATLAAFGAERALRGAVRLRYLIGAGIGVALLGLLALTGGLSNMALVFAANVPDGAARVLQNEAALAGGGMRTMMFGALLCIALFLISSRRLPRDLAGALIAALVAADLWSIARIYWQFSPPASELFAKDAAIEYLQKQPGPFRVLSFAPPRSIGRDVYVSYDGLMAHRIPVAMGYHGNELGNYRRLASSNFEEMSQGGEPDWGQLGNPNFWRLANIRYTLTNLPDLGIEGATRVAGPVRNVAGTEVYVHQLPGDFSYAWVTPVGVSANDNAAHKGSLDPRFDVRRAALLDRETPVLPYSGDSLPAALAIRAATTAYAPGSATIELSAPAPAGSVLVVSENYYPGWQATVDGKSARVGRAYVSLIGVPLTAGARKIELQFVNATYFTGRTITWAAVALAFLLIAAGAVPSRRTAARG